MRILALVPALYDTTPGQRFRMEQWARYLEPQGFRFDFVPFENEALRDVLHRNVSVPRKALALFASVGRRLALTARSSGYDLVYVFREATLLGPPLVERIFAHSRLPMIFDFDDAIWIPYSSPTNRSFSRLKMFGKAAPICRLSDHVLVGNSYLAEYAARYNNSVTIVPTTIDTDLYVPQCRSPNVLPVIGWTGSFSTVQHLDTLREVFASVRRRVDYHLRVVGTPAYQVDGVAVTAVPWRADREVDDIGQMDIGIMPLPDEPWTRGKCGLKLLQYMALGLPVVASPVGVNSAIVRDGVNGFLASSPQEWEDRLTLLAGDADLRRRMGAAGRTMVEEHYSARVWAPRVGKIISDLVSAAR